MMENMETLRFLFPWLHYKHPAYFCQLDKNSTLQEKP